MRLSHEVTESLMCCGPRSVHTQDTTTRNSHVCSVQLFLSRALCIDKVGFHPLVPREFRSYRRDAGDVTAFLVPFLSGRCALPGVLGSVA